MLGQLTWKDKSDSSLDLSGGDSWLLVVSGELGSLSRDLLEDIVDKGVHDAHGLGGDTGVRVNLLQHLVDVDLVGLDLGLPLLARDSSLLDSLLGWFLVGLLWWHGCVCVCLSFDVERVRESL